MTDKKETTRVADSPSSFRETLSRLADYLKMRPVRLAMLIAAAALLVLSLTQPYWAITLHAPQYPKGLNVQIYAYKLSGDVSEVDGLNHYIGMIKLEDAGSFERAISRFAVPVIAALALASFWIRGRWRWLAVTPIILYPIVFVIDLYAWLYYAGHNLDPTAALSSAIKPFTPRLLGEGIIGQFSTVATFGAGFYMALAATVLVVVATLAAGREVVESDVRRDRPVSHVERPRLEQRPRLRAIKRHDHAPTG